MMETFARDFVTLIAFHYDNLVCSSFEHLEEAFLTAKKINRIPRSFKSLPFSVILNSTLEKETVAITLHLL
jgi:hypothetical protein